MNKLIPLTPILFGALLLFALLTATMYLTRNINWFSVSNDV